MFAISATPIRVYNSVEKKPEAAPRHKPHRHWRQHAMNPQMPRAECGQISKIQELERKLDKYEKVNEKLKMLAGWNLRSTKSALKDVQQMIETLEDLYGDEAFEEEPPK
jgi:hypothetical protein